MRFNKSCDDYPVILKHIIMLPTSFILDAIMTKNYILIHLIQCYRKYVCKLVKKLKNFQVVWGNMVTIHSSNLLEFQVKHFKCRRSNRQFVYKTK